MATPFQNQRSDDAIIITPQVSRNTQDIGEQIFKRPKTFDSFNPSNPARRQLSLFFKTRLCVKFKSGTCPNGADCNFAHGLEDLRRPPPNWQELASKEVNNNVLSEEQLLTRNRVCRKYYRGEICNYGERCTFVHVEPGTLRERSVSDLRDGNGVNGLINETIVVVGSANNNNLSASNNGNSHNHQKGFSWRTRMCNKWEATGSCPFGEKCHFAHGLAELLGQKNQTDLDKGNNGTAAAAAAAAPSKTHHLPITTTEMATITSTAKKRKAGGFAKFEGQKRISSLYADWIDDPFFCI